MRNRSQQRSSARRLHLEHLEDRLTPTTFLVTSAGNFGLHTLRNELDGLTGPGPDTITFAPALAGATIDLSTADDSSIGPSALVISTDVTIEGSGQTITLASGAAAMRLFTVTPTGKLTLEDVTLSGGIARGGAGGRPRGAGRRASAGRSTTRAPSRSSAAR
jgi:hypothetical protein